MITKEIFVEVLSDVKKQLELDDRFINSIIPEYLDGVKPVSKLSEISTNSLIKLLAYSFDNDFNEYKDILDWLEWFMYENDFGNRKFSCYIDKDEYKITNSEEFYDFLIIWIFVTF